MLFIEKTQEYFTTSYSLILTAIEWLRKTELTPYNYPAWILLLISIFLLISIITLFIVLKKNTKLEYNAYTQDSIYGTIWKWKWIKNEISNLQCHCPTCDSILVYDDTSCHSKYTDLTKTDFICESCKSKLITSIHGGNKTYAFTAIKREIERRIRTEEYKINMHLSK